MTCAHSHVPSLLLRKMSANLNGSGVSRPLISNVNVPRPVPVARSPLTSIRSKSNVNCFMIGNASSQGLSLAPETAGSPGGENTTSVVHNARSPSQFLSRDAFVQGPTVARIAALASICFPFFIPNGRWTLGFCPPDDHFDRVPFISKFGSHFDPSVEYSHLLVMVSPATTT